VERPMPRVTEADKKGDERSLDRRLDRTLYLLVKGSEGRWEFPASALIGRENLHEVSPQVLIWSWRCSIDNRYGTHPLTKRPGC
jgi:large subunit ribosomal protein L46